MSSIIYYSGDKPVPGKYYCTLCAMIVVIDENNPTLPICEKCQAKTWRKLP